MNSIEREILEILQQNCRTSNEDIANALGISTEDAAAAIKRLEDDKVILAYSAVIDREKMDDEVIAMIEVKVTIQRELGFEAIAERIYRYDEVKSLYLLSGNYDFMVTVQGRSIKKVAQFVHEKLAVIDNVVSTSTHFMLKNYKENGVMFCAAKKDGRLVVSP